MEAAALVAESLFTSSESPKVFSGLGNSLTNIYQVSMLAAFTKGSTHYLSVQANHNASKVFIAMFDIKVHYMKVMLVDGNSEVRVEHYLC
jgi:hypothetical protein